jgi:N-acetylmuramoyl-L-alanine amidase
LTAQVEDEGLYCPVTEQAVIDFQASRGLRTDGICDAATWAAVVEASWSLGDRLLYLTSPNLRGDDVVELQTLLSRLGFDCGRVDGIFGPLCAHAVSEFQSNAGLSVDGICSTDTVRALHRLSSQSGEGPGIAIIRETEKLLAAERGFHRVVVGQFGGFSGVARLVSRSLREQHDVVMLVDEPEVAAHVRAANHFAANAYIGLEGHAEPECTIAYYAVDGFVSVGGQALAESIARELVAELPHLRASAVGMRLPVLRETRMPAVLCSLGPFQEIADNARQAATAISRAFLVWQDDLHSA